MSYAIAPTFESNRLGVRTLSGYRMLGDISGDVAQGMIDEGYNPSVIISLATAGATDAQLQNLWDTYSAGSQAFAVAANQLLTTLTGGPGGAASAPGYPQSAQPTTVSTAFGVYDLTQEAAWNGISTLFTTVQQLLNQVAQKAPNDTDVISKVTEFNSLVVRWAGYYQQAFGSAPSPLPMASLPSRGLSGLGVIPIALAAVLTAGVVALLASLYAIYQWAQVKLAQVTASQQVQSQAITAAQAQAASLLAQAATLDKTNPQLAAQLRAQAAQLMGQVGSSAGGGQPSGPLTSWFTQNWAAVAAVIAVLALGPPLIKKF